MTSLSLKLVSQIGRPEHAACNRLEYQGIGITGLRMIDNIEDPDTLRLRLRA